MSLKTESLDNADYRALIGLAIMVYEPLVKSETHKGLKRVTRVQCS